MGKIDYNKQYRSGRVTNGAHKSGNRAHLRAMGLLDQDIEKPFIGIANSYNAMNPGHMHLRELVESRNFEYGYGGVLNNMTLLITLTIVGIFVKRLNILPINSLMVSLNNS